MIHLRLQKRQSGFTLVEVIVVMVILAVIASFSTAFVVGAIKNFVSVSQKNDLLSETRLAAEYMTRRLRNALPYSVRTTNNNNCLEFMPIVSSGLYREAVPSIVNGAFANGSTAPIITSPFVISGGTTDYISIGASASSELYGALPGSLAEIDSVDDTSVTLTANKQWLRNSINQRFYIVETPSAFCLTNNQLRLYRNLSILDNEVNISQEYDLLAHSVLPLGVPFSISSAVEDRNIRVTASLIFTHGDNRFESVKHVVIRNVP